jgi:hypothetical protein
MNKEGLYTAIEALENAAPVKAQWTEGKELANNGDGILLLVTINKEYTFTVELKKELRAVNIPRLAANKEHYDNLLVVARVIYPNIRKKLQEMNINYMDTFGNIFLQQGELLLLITGEKAQVPVVINTGRAFNKAGLRLIYHLLTQEDFLQKTYREMAAECETALGNINYIIKDLQEQGYLVKKNNKDWLLKNRETLINKWAENFLNKLQPEYLMGTFRFQATDGIKYWNKLKLDATKTHWGGEPAADILTNYLQPATLTIYTEENRIDLIKKYRLIPDINGNIKLYTKFWKATEKKETVHPLVIYADLLGINDPRTVELANMIYNEYLKK